MYEIWLTLNILYELGLQYLPVVIGTALLWLALMAVAAALTWPLAAMIRRAG